MNVLFVFPDQHRGDWLSSYADYPVRTPNIGRLLHEGAGFERAWTPSPLCAPARACIATGRDFDRCTVKHNRHNLALDADNFYRRLRAGGYRVATCGKLDLLKEEMDWGLDGRHVVAQGSKLAQLGFTDGIDSAGKHDAINGFERGLAEPYLAFLRQQGLAETHVADYARRGRNDMELTIVQGRDNEPEPPPAYAYTEPTPLPDFAYCDNWVGRIALDLLKEFGAERTQPWFLAVNFCGPHEPVDVTAAMQAAWRGVNFPLPRARQNDDPERQQWIRRNYAAMIECIDRWLGVFMQFLDDSGQRDNTLIVYSSDHGDMLGDKNLWGKQVPFDASVRVPLILSGPGFARTDFASDTPVSLIDLAPTFLDYAGLEIPDDYDGRSLRPFLEGAASRHREYATTGLGAWRSISDGRYKLVAGYREDCRQAELQFDTLSHYDDSDELLFDLEADPAEMTDIGQAQPLVRKRLRAALQEAVAAR